MLLVVDVSNDYINKSGKHESAVLCKCDCGNTCIAKTSELKNNHKKSCGCLKNKRENLIGKRFGKLTVVDNFEDFIKNDGTHLSRWVCKCDCGNNYITYGTNLVRGLVKSCGCIRKELLQKRKDDLTGQRFGRLIAKQEVRKNDKEIHWLCECDCGNDIIVVSKSLKSGNTTSCGCYKKEQTSKNLSLNLLNKKFGNLVVVERCENFIDSDNNKHSQWICKCDCGNTKKVIGSYLIAGKVKSCGCLISYGEKITSEILNRKGILFQKQYTFDDLLSDKGYKLKFDFALFDKNNNLTCLIEYQGQQHFCSHEETFGKLQREVTDKLKKEYCDKKHIRLYEILYNENIEDKIKYILNDIHFNF